MKRSSFLSIALLFLLFLPQALRAQNDSIYHARLAGLSKVWGFLKYFHSEPAKCSIDWDKQLIYALQNIGNNSTYSDYNNAISALIDSAGPMAIATSQPPVTDPWLSYNKNFSWINDPSLFNASVIARLDTVRVNFRPQYNCYVQQSLATGEYAKFLEQPYASPVYPSEEYRLLALFRYWNIVNYFFPYKYLVDQPWDSTLEEFIPRMIIANDSKSYHLAVKELTVHIDDSHAFTFGSQLNTHLTGYYYPPFYTKIVENEMVITKVLNNVTSIKPGDVITKFEGWDIDVLRDSVRRYAEGSNMVTRNRNLNTILLSGNAGPLELEIDNGSGAPVTVTLARDITAADYYDLIDPVGDIWKVIDTAGCSFGYVDMGRLMIDDVAGMMSVLSNTDGIIFDIRNYPNGTIDKISEYLFREPVPFALFTKPDVEHPGTFSWMQESYVGTFNNSPYRGAVLILHDEETQSQAEFTVMAFEQHYRAVKIGSQTAAADGNVTSFPLPGGITTYFTGLGVYYTDTTETQRVGIVPDIHVTPTITGIRAGRDEVLERALSCTLLSVPAEPATPGVELYPNPAETDITLKVHEAGASVLVTNVLGQPVMSIQHMASGGVNMNVSALAPGTYFVSVTTVSGTSVTRFMKR